MPANVLEKPTTVESTPPGVSRVGSTRVDPLADRARSAQQNVSGERQPLSRRQRIDLVLHNIFEGREEYLGWTPE
ncbi:MAG: hypothetical protein WA172_17915 [Terriglobales bacterium]